MTMLVRTLGAVQTNRLLSLLLFELLKDFTTCKKEMTVRRNTLFQVPDVKKETIMF